MTNLIMMIGLPGSGKTLWAEKQGYENIISSNDIWNELEVLGKHLDYNAFVSKRNRRVVRSLSNGRETIVDSVNLESKHRKYLLQQIKKPNSVHKVAVVMATPVELCAEMSKYSKDTLLIKMTRFQLPVLGEGFDEIRLVFPEHIEENYSMLELLKNAHGFDRGYCDDQVSLGEHLKQTYDGLKQFGDSNLAIAGRLHDIGKLVVPDQKGYNYKHKYQNISAYTTLFPLKLKGLKDESILEICQYINYHMLTTTNIDEKTIRRHKRLFGEEFYENLLRLQVANRDARRVEI